MNTRDSKGRFAKKEDENDLRLVIPSFIKNYSFTNIDYFHINALDNNYI